METLDLAIIYFLKSPITYTICLICILLTFGFVFVKIVQSLEDPIKSFCSIFEQFLNQAFKEITFKAGFAGTLDLVVVVGIIVLGLAILVNPTILGTIGTSGNDASKHHWIIFMVAVFAFLASIKMSIDHDKFLRLNNLD